jgi:DNA-binding Xre family transcriptional regulator
MYQTKELVLALKRQLKARGVTYAEVAKHLELSEASVKRQFSQLGFSLRTLESICDLLKMEVAELVRVAAEAHADVHRLSNAQEADLVSDPRRLLVAVCVLNSWTLAHITAIYRLSEAECIGHLLQLDRIGLITLLPENRVRLRIARDFTWLPDGPIHRFFRDRAQTEFLDAGFNQPGELMRFQHAMLSPAATQRFQQRLQRLMEELAQLHEECVAAPEEARFGTSFLLAMRPWEPAVFESLRRAPDARTFPLPKI